VTESRPPPFERRRGETAIAAGKGARVGEAGEDSVFRLVPTASAPAEARRTIEEVAKGLQRELRFRAELLASELVANSVSHAQLDRVDDIELRIGVRPSSLRVEVWDGGPGFEPEARLPGSDAVSGRGIALLDALAERWGTFQLAQRFGVWFEVEPHTDPPLEPKTDSSQSSARAIGDAQPMMQTALARRDGCR
jgi:anti-sigma regulatory factor (Ser/Thr protein kinase)